MHHQSFVVFAVLTVTAGAVSVPDTNPLQFIFSQCPDPNATGNIGDCARDLLQAALEKERPQFATGVTMGSKTVVLDPLSLADVAVKPNRSAKWSLKSLQLRGLRTVDIEQVVLTEKHLAVRVSADQLTAAAALLVKLGFIPLRPRVELSLQNPRIMIAASYSSEDGHLKLSTVKAKILMDGYECAVKGAASIGRSVEAALNDNSEKIIEFITPSLEAALVREVNALPQKKVDNAVSWLERIIV